MNKTKKTSNKSNGSKAAPPKITDAQFNALQALHNGPSDTVNKKTGAALVARGWALDTKKGFKITAAGKKASAETAAA